MKYLLVSDCRVKGNVTREDDASDSGDLGRPEVPI